ncbi:hypothetical protein RIF29_24142 [Crotalaria pallida]|uniref:Uncharacterized protein n=1 Tax=Crotalaria pallida TaxID=3830 RepID=A0AAN9HY66_CROPI
MNACPPKQYAPKSTADNEEYTRLMSRLDELEKEEELATESGSHSDEDKETTSDTDDIPYQRPIDNNLQNSKFASLAVQSKAQDGKNVAKKVRFIDQGEKLIHPEEKIVKATTPSKSDVQHQTSQLSYDSAEAFTGSIIEHAENIKITSREQSSTPAQDSGSQPSKPVSRFKMQRR